MGRAKEIYMEEIERGYKVSEKHNICSEHLFDSSILK